ASLGHGEFSTIAQDGGVQQIVTPYDDKIAAASAEVDSTAVIYGGAEGRKEDEGKMAVAAAAPAAAQADRAHHYAKKPMSKGEGRAREDITAQVASGGMDVGSLDTEKLPDDLKTKSKEEIKAEIDRRNAVRHEAQKQLDELTKQRGEYLKKHAGEDKD